MWHALLLAPQLPSPAVLGAAPFSSQRAPSGLAQPCAGGLGLGLALAMLHLTSHRVTQRHAGPAAGQCLTLSVCPSSALARVLRYQGACPLLGVGTGTWRPVYWGHQTPCQQGGDTEQDGSSVALLELGTVAPREPRLWSWPGPNVAGLNHLWSGACTRRLWPRFKSCPPLTWV